MLPVKRNGTVASAGESACSILPIIAEDGFRFPTQSFYDDLTASSPLEKGELQTYIRIIKAVFQEIAVVFSPQNYSSTQEDLDLRAKQVAWRLQSGALKSVSSKLAVKEGDAEAEDGTDFSSDDRNQEPSFTEISNTMAEEVEEIQVHEEAF